MNEDYDLFKELLNGNNDVDIFSMNLEESTEKFTNTINQQIPLEQNALTAPVTRLTDDLNLEDFEALNQIMNEIAELKKQPNDATSTEPMPVVKGELSRMNSLGAVLRDYFLQDFDAFEANVQIDDPMLGTCLTNGLKDMIAL